MSSGPPGLQVPRFVGTITPVNRPLWVLLGIVAVAGAAAAVSLTMGAGDPAPVVERGPARGSPEGVRDTSAPAVAARGVPDVAVPNLNLRPATPRTTRPTPAAAPEPVAPAAPTMATLHITSDVPGAQVFIDRKFIGVAPVTAEDIVPGARQINVSAPGYDGVAETHDVAAGPRDIMISLKTIRLDQSIPVKHKHGIGSCAGRLIATAEGLRYETDNKDDGFRVALPGLETFKVDFIARNLRVKVKGGRTYDFTDPGGKADPLYLFHEAVEKARLRQVSR